MSKMDICTCKITLAGDKRQVIVRGPTNPMTYPEVNLMMYMHGDRFVEDIVVIKQVETTNQAELENLRVKYKQNARDAFPGQRPRLPLEAPDEIPRELIPDEDILTEGAAPPVPEDTETAPARRRRPAKQVA